MLRAGGPYMGLDFSASDGMEASVPHICPRTLRAYVGREYFPGGTGFDFDLRALTRLKPRIFSAL